MKKLSYIFQMNGFLQRRRDDRLPAGAVLLYLVLFEECNKRHWLAEWVRMSAKELLFWTGLNSSNTLYRARDLLASLGYIEFRVVGSGSRRWVEYKLLPLYGDDGDGQTKGQIVAMSQDKTEAAGVAQPGCEGDAVVADCEEAKEVRAAGVPQKITPEEYEQLCMAFADCLEREISSKERTKILDLLLAYGTDNVLDALAAVRDETAKSMEFCEAFLRRRKLGTETRVSRPAYPNESKWAGWRLA